MSVDAAGAWASLSEPERACLELAFEALGAATIPVGAVVVDAGGSIVARGRNRVYDSVAPPPRQIQGSMMAHAEINALAQLDPERHYRDHTLVTSLEPCPMCLWATRMATVGRVRYLGVDAYAGADGHPAGDNPFTRRMAVEVDGPLSGSLGRLAAALLPAFYLERKPDGPVIAALREQTPAVLALAEQLVAAGARQAARDGTSLETFLGSAGSALDAA